MLHRTWPSHPPPLWTAASRRERAAPMRVQLWRILRAWTAACTRGRCRPLSGRPPTWIPCSHVLPHLGEGRHDAAALRAMMPCLRVGGHSPTQSDVPAQSLRTPRRRCADRFGESRPILLRSRASRLVAANVTLVLSDDPLLDACVRDSFQDWGPTESVSATHCASRTDADATCEGVSPCRRIQLSQ